MPAGGAARGGDRWLPGGRSCISPPSPRDPAGMKGSTSHRRSGRRRLQTDPGRRRPWIRPCATAATSSDHGQLDVLSLFFVRVLKKQEGFFVTAVRAGGRPSLPRRVRAGGPARGSDDGGADAGQLRRGAAGPAGGSGGGRRIHGGSGKRSSSGRPHLSLPNPPTAGVVVQGLGVHVPHCRRDLRPRRARPRGNLPISFLLLSPRSSLAGTSR